MRAWRKWAGKAGDGGTRREIAEAIIARADAARDARRFRDAAILFEQALLLAPGRADIRVQVGHMFKEAGDYAAAERHYVTALGDMAEDPDLALQLGHFYKIAGRAGEAVRHYRRAGELQPGWAEPANELALIEAAALPKGGADAQIDDRAFALELLPGRGAVPQPLRDQIVFRRLGGRRELSEWGRLPLLCGVEAVRGVCVSAVYLDAARVRLDGDLVHEGRLLGFPASDGLVKYVFNLWIDLSDVVPGLHTLEIELVGEDGASRGRREAVLTAPPLREAEHPGSDGVVDPVPQADPAALEAAIRARPSMVRSAVRSLLPIPIRSILAIRADQMGDMVISVPALRRLRALFPGARVVGLVTEANAELARALQVFDEVIVGEFPEDPAERRRVMTRAEQTRLRSLLAPYAFDIAIDLAASWMSRPLLRLSGAKFTAGFSDADWPWLSVGIEGGTHDPKNHLEAAPQSAKILTLVERLGTLAREPAPVMPRSDLDRARLAALGLDPAQRYAVVHTGARIAFSRWRGYPELVARLATEAGLAVAVLTEDAGFSAALPVELRESGRVVVIDRRLAFDDLDALLSFCAVFVGNDSGPKHLAALRGAPVVSIHSARINWNEWGQEQTGVIVSRRVPCAGCAISYDEEECGKDFACITDIRVHEVFDAVLALIF